jgi:hypothetical protein
VPDAIDFKDEMQRQFQGLKKFTEVKTTSLLDGDATYTNIVDAFKILAGVPKEMFSASQQSILTNLDRIRPDDGLFIFYAGHGVGDSSHFYPGKSFSDEESHAISDVTLSSLLEPIAAAESFLIIDACQSGELLDGGAMVGPVNSLGLAQLAYEKGIYILAASQGQEPAAESAGLNGGHGYLTYVLIEEAIKQGKGFLEPEMSVRSWFEYASHRVPALRPEQHPRVFYERDITGSTFTVAKQMVKGIDKKSGRSGSFWPNHDPREVSHLQSKHRYQPPQRGSQ